MIALPHPTVLLPLLEVCREIAGHGSRALVERQRGQWLIAQLENDRMVRADLLDSLVNRRVEAVRTAFGELLGHFAEQLRSIETDIARQAALRGASDDPVYRADMQNHIADARAHAERIRRDCLTAYHQMTTIVMLLGCQHDFVGQRDRAVLALPPMADA